MLASAGFNYYEDEFFDAFRITRADGALTNPELFL